MTPARPYQLYGSEVSYFTGKVRAYLRWKGLPFDEVAADAQVYRDVIVARVGFPVIPVVVTPDGETLQDSSEIIDTLEQRHGEPGVVPHTPLQRLVSQLMEVYGDEWLVIPAMHYRWHHNREWAMREFGAMNAPQASPEEQFEIGQRRAVPFAKAAVLLGGEPPMHAAIEASYEALLAELDAHFAVHPYLLGTRPSLGDFGLIGPLYAHQYRDPASGELMRRLAPHVVQWVLRMQQPPHPREGDFLPGDEIPDTLVPILQRMMREQMPVLADSVTALKTWMAQNPGERRVPRVLGSHAFALQGATGQRIVRPYSLWMMQRARDVRAAMPPDDQQRADAWLAGLGGAAFSGFEDPPRLVRDGMSVALA